MANRKPVIAGNWKMFKSGAEATEFALMFVPLVKDVDHCEIVLAPPFTALEAVRQKIGATRIGLAAQNVHWDNDGAQTGEVSASMLVDAGCRYVIIGHSERRQFYGETDETVQKKVNAALAESLTPIVCMGEVLDEREAGRTEQVLQRQFEGGLTALTTPEFSRIIIAYEPVWAIGTGKTATPELADETHSLLRDAARKAFGDQAAEALRILYGGSVKPDNVAGLMAKEEIDGALVGGASLKPDTFAAIVNF